MQAVQPHPRMGRFIEALNILSGPGNHLPALNHPALITALAVLGAISGLAIATLLGHDPREAAAYAAACVMIGGAIAIGHHGRADSAADTGTSLPRIAGTAVTGAPASVGQASVGTDTGGVDPFDEAHQQMRAVAHDLKAPLGTVSSYLELIAEGAFGAVSDEARDALRRAAAVSERARTVVDSALRKDAIDTASRPASAPTQIDLNRTVSDVTAALTGAMRERQATVAVTGRLPVVLGDADSLFRVFENLVQNAIKFCPDGVSPHVTIRSRRIDGRAVEVTVVDNGAGLPHDAPLLVAAGVRGVNASGTPGHGIGLATVARLVARMDGTVTFEDRRDGGTAVRVTLPTV